MKEKKFKEIISGFDNLSIAFSVYEITDVLRREGYEYKDGTSTVVNAEILAFNFCENANEVDPASSRYYGPTWTYQTVNGVVGFPNEELVTKEIFEYWARRSAEVKHPALIVRYNDFVSFPQR